MSQAILFFHYNMPYCRKYVFVQLVATDIGSMNIQILFGQFYHFE